MIFGFSQGISGETIIALTIVLFAVYLLATALLGREIRHGRITVGGIVLIVGAIYCSCLSFESIAPGETQVVYRKQFFPPVGGIRGHWEENVIRVNSESGYHSKLPWESFATVPLLRKHPTALTFTIPVKGGNTRCIAIGVWTSVSDPSKAYKMTEGPNYKLKIDQTIAEIAELMVRSLVGDPFKPEQEESIMRASVASILPKELHRIGLAVEASPLAVEQTPGQGQKLAALK